MEPNEWVDLESGDIVLRSKRSSLLFVQLFDSGYDTNDMCRFIDLDTSEPYQILVTALAARFRGSNPWVLERSSQLGHSGSVNSVGENAIEITKESTMTQNLTSQDPATSNTAEVTATSSPEPKAKKTRTVDYTRTDKRPHSFRYKRHSTFVARAGAVSLSKDADGSFVIGPAPEGSTADAAKLEAGQLELVSVKKRANGKIAIAFKHAELGEVVAYDARAARAALRAG
jgi:hypothetical protein